MRLAPCAAVLVAGCGAVSIDVATPATTATDAVAPGFTLPSTIGPVALADALAGGDVLLVFYRGHW